MSLVAVLGRVWLASRGTELFADDAYYYLVIAKRLAATGQATFDGLTRTNGFHPLLLWLEAAGYTLARGGGDPQAEYLVAVCAHTTAFFLCVLFAICAAWRVGENGLVTRRTLTAITGMLLALLLVPRLTSIYLSGMESVLVLPLLTAVLVSVAQARWRTAGISAALLVLARLDTLPFLVLPLAAICAVQQRRARRSAFQTAALIGLPATGIAGIIVLHNWLSFGHMQPISAAIKSTFPTIHLQLGNLFGNADERLGLRLSLFGAVTGGALVIRPGRTATALRHVALIAAVLALLQGANLMLFQAWTKSTPVWYLASALPLGAFAGAVGVVNRLPLCWVLRATLVMLVVVLGLNVAWLLGGASRLGTPVEASLPFAEGTSSANSRLIRLVRASDTNSTWAASDCGQVAFWSGRRFVNLDGLVNDFHYQDALASRRLREYLTTQRVRYLIVGPWEALKYDPVFQEPMYHYRVAPSLFSGEYVKADYFLYSYFHRSWSDTLQLPRSAEVWRSEPLQDGRMRARHVVFDLGSLLSP